MTNLLSISSHDFARQAVDTGPSIDEASTSDPAITPDSSRTFGEALADATRSQSPDELTDAPAHALSRRNNKAPASQPKAAADSQSAEPSPETPPEQAQELPSIADDASRKTDAAPLPTPAVAPNDPQLNNTEKIMPPAPDAADDANGHTETRTKVRTEARDARLPKASGSDRPHPPDASKPEPGTPPPQPAVVPAPVETPVVLVPEDRTAKSGQPQQHQESANRPSELQAQSGESITSEESSQPPMPPSRSQIAPPPSTAGASVAASAPPPVHPPGPSSAPSPTAGSFLDLQPQSGARGSAPSAHAASTFSSMSTPQAAPEPGADEFGSQMVRGALAMTRSTGGAMTIRLEPESLGSLRIQMQMSHGRVAVQFHAQTAQARGLLNQHVETLRTALESHGLKLDSIQIHTLTKPGFSGSTGHEPQSHSQSGGDRDARHDAGGQQSRGHGDTTEREAQYRQAARAVRSPSQPGASWRQQWDQAASSASTQTPGSRQPLTITGA